jgi:uncharacterized protein (DUF427 family)
MKVPSALQPIARIVKPGHTVTVPADHHAARVTSDEHLVAETSAALRLEESSLPTRTYIPRADVQATLERSEKQTHCPWKGDATYWHVTVNGIRHEDAAWSYEEPIDDVKIIAGHLCFDLADEFEVTLGAAVG